MTVFIVLEAWVIICRMLEKKISFGGMNVIDKNVGIFASNLVLVSLVPVDNTLGFVTLEMATGR